MTKSESSASEKPTKKKQTSTLHGSQTNGMSREEILRALKNQKPSDFYVWDGKDEDDKPLTQKEMVDGLLAYKKRGRPFSATTKEQIAIRLDAEVLDAFRKEGPGWQTRINDALKDWLKHHWRNNWGQIFNWGQININFFNRLGAEANGGWRFVVPHHEEAPISLCP